jgi:hypothetical protein
MPLFCVGLLLMSWWRDATILCGFAAYVMVARCHYFVWVCCLCHGGVMSLFCVGLLLMSLWRDATILCGFAAYVTVA